MNIKQIILRLIAPVALLFPGFLGCIDRHGHDSHHGHGAHGGHDDHEEQARGPHGGKLFCEGDFELELKIFESGVPPQYRIYAFDHGKPLSPTNFQTQVKLKRLGEEEELFTFKPVEDFLYSERVVAEPHSFDGEIIASYSGREFRWKFSSYEGRTQIADRVAELSGIKTETSAARTISEQITVNGRVLPSEHRIAHIIPRFPGVVKQGLKHIGDSVAKGETLAIVESNQSLQPFEVRSQIAGTVINGHLIPGEFVPENQWVYIVADLSEVWVDLLVSFSQRELVKAGQRVTISAPGVSDVIEGKIEYIAPYADDRSQSQIVRAIIANEKGLLLPGMYVQGRIAIDEKTVDIAVRNAAFQSFRDWTVVFEKVGDTYEIRPLELGKTDGEWSEVISGLSAGRQYVTENSFLIKADILKSGASHDH